MSVSENSGVFPPNHLLKNKVFHYFHHPFWGKHPYFWISTHDVFLVKIFTWKLVVTSELLVAFRRQQVGAGRGSYEVVAGAQGKGGQNMAIRRRVPGQNSTKNDFSKLESPFETNHVEFVAPGLFQHFAVWSVSLWRLVGTWILQVVQASLQLNELVKMSQKCCYFLTWCNNESEMKRKVNAHGNERFTSVCGTCPMELGCSHDRSWIDQLEDALLWPRGCSRRGTTPV